MILGATVRRLRRQRNYSQVNFAKDLGISASYLNLIESNRRSLTGELLVKIAEKFGIELSEFKIDDSPNLYDDILEIFSDDLFEDIIIKNIDIKDIIINQPNLAKAIRMLYDKYCFLKEDTKAFSFLDGGSKNLLNHSSRLPAEVVSDFLQDNNNFFSILEEKAKKIRKQAMPVTVSPELNSQLLIDFLEKKFATKVAILPPDKRHRMVRKYDPVAKTLVLSDLLPLESRTFLIAQQIGLFSADKEINKIIAESDMGTSDSISLARIALTNYFAGALLMPYEKYYEYSTVVGYDIEKLMHKFGVSFEQCCHRILTLQKPGLSGVPFHLLRVDRAGNISKRISFSGISLPRYSGACPRWNLYSSFSNPEKINIQVSEMNNGDRYFCIAKCFRKYGGGYGLPQSFYSIGIGCRLEEADKLVYYRTNYDYQNADSIIKVGVSCRTCSISDCRQRAHPPVNKRINIDENVRGLSSYVTPKP